MGTTPPITTNNPQNTRPTKPDQANLPSDDGDTYQKFRMQFDWVKFQQSLKTLEFQHYKFIV